MFFVFFSSQDLRENFMKSVLIPPLLILENNPNWGCSRLSHVITECISKENKLPQIQLGVQVACGKWSTAYFCKLKNQFWLIFFCA